MKLSDFRYFTFPQDSTRDSRRPWLIFLHGLLGSAANWRKITPAFETKYNILTYDQRGHGRSFAPLKGYAPEDYAHDLHFLMEELRIVKAMLIGHSMGGRNALTFTHLYPEKVSRLIIEDIGPEASLKNGQGLIDLLKSIPVPFFTKLEAKNYLMNKIGNPQLGNFLYTNLSVDADGKAHWSFDLNNIVETIRRGRGTSRWGEVQSLRCPTLVIRGEMSDELSHLEYERMLSENTLVQGVEIPEAGHWVHFDRPHEFICAIKNFLGK